MTNRRYHVGFLDDPRCFRTKHRVLSSFMRRHPRLLRLYLRVSQGAAPVREKVRW